MLVKFLFLISACILIQVRCDKLTIREEEDKDIIDIAKAALQALEKVVEAVVSVSLVTLEGLESAIETVEKTVLNLAAFAINQVANLIFENLNELKKDAAELAIDIIDCTEDREEDLKLLVDKFLNNTADCAVVRVNEVLESFVVVAEDLRDINEQVKNITLELDNCTTDANTTACVIKVIDDIETAVTELPEKVTENVEVAKKRVDELENYLYECYHDNLHEMEKTSQEIYNGIVECVEAKIFPPSVVHMP